MMSLRRLVEVAKQLRKNGHTAFEDPLIRQKIGRAYVEIEVMRYSGLRVLTRFEKGQRPGPESSLAKLYYSEFGKRYQEWVMEILGPYGGLTGGMPDELNDRPRRRDGAARQLGGGLPRLALRHHRRRHLRSPKQYRWGARAGFAQRDTHGPNRNQSAKSKSQAEVTVDE